MADATARKAAIKKASNQVRTGGGFVRRAAVTGRFVSTKQAEASKKKR
jgi:hypothetical protein